MSSATDVVYRFDVFELNAEHLELRREGTLVHADTLVLRLLACLVRSAGRLITKEELVDAVWDRRAVADNAITVAVARLRKTLGGHGSVEFVATVYGRGYRFVADVTVARSNKSSPSSPSHAPEAESPFVGRDSLVARLHRALADARAGHGRACLLMGEPGIGKTRAVEAFEREVAGPQLRVVWGYCREGGDTPPLSPFLRVLREVMASIPTAELERTLGGAALETLGLIGGLPASGQDAANAARNFSGPGRHLGFDAILRTLAFAAEQTPLLLVLDDLHRADAGSLELFNFLLEEISRTKILVVATLRPSTSDSAQTLLLRALGHRNCERITLERLQQPDVARYVAAVLDDADGRLGQAVFAKSEGNPFFMVELSRQLRHAARPDPSTLGVDDAALDLIRQRVARLDADARGVLSAAAVIGRSFELHLLQVITDREPAALMASLDDALAAEVVVAAPDSTTGFAFGHELLRMVLYDALPAAHRRRWHVKIAEALEPRVNNAGVVAPSELAYHLYAGLPESDLRKTVHYCREAANAASVYGNPDVVRYLRQALEALSLMKQPSVRLRMSLLLTATVYARGCAQAEYVGLLQEALQLAREHGDGSKLVRGAYMLNPHPGFPPLPGGDAALNQALLLLAPDEVESRALAMATLACTAPTCFDGERARDLLAQAEQLARRSESTLTLSGTLLCKLFLEGGESDSIDVANELEQVARRHTRQLPVVPGDLALYRSVRALQAGDVKALPMALDMLEASSRELRHVELMWHSERWRVLTSINTDPPADAFATLERLHRRAAQSSIIGNEPFCAFDRLVVFAAFGRAVVVDDGLRRVLAYDASEPPGIWAMKVRSLATAGLTREALASLQAVSVERLKHLPRDRDYLGTLGHLARAALLIGASDYAAALYALLAQQPEAFTGHVAFFSEGSVQQLLGMLAYALGRHDEALVHMETAIGHSERAGLGLRSAEARLQFAMYLIEHGAVGQHRRALALAREARASAERIGAVQLARDAATLVERTHDA